MQPIKLNVIDIFVFLLNFPHEVNMARFHKILMGSLLLSVFAQANVVDLPFNMSIDTKIVSEVAAAPTDQLIAVMAKHGVKVLLVKTSNPKKALNPTLSKLELASAELLKKAEFQESYEGRMIGKSNPCCSLKQDTILIRDTALNYTLIHEFLHSKLRIKGVPSKVDVETQFAVAHRRLTFFQRKLFEKPYDLTNPLWRRDIIDANKTVIKLMYERLQIGQTQEALIEKTLKSFITPGSPHYDGARQAEGLKYGEAMINNGIDIFNLSYDHLNWIKNTVQGLRDAIVSGDLEKSMEKDLTAADNSNFQASVTALQKDLEPIKAEILKIKAWYTK